MNKPMQIRFTRKPRNPLVAAARFRQAGAHRKSRKAGRQAGAAGVRKEMETLKEGP